MKKVLLSALVVIVFVAYSLHARHDGSGFKLSLLSTASQNTSSNAGSTVPNADNAGGNTGTPPSPTVQYKDGMYSGTVADAFYGYVQVQATIQGGKITRVDFLQRPNDNPTSRAINDQADPMLSQEAIQAQTAQVNMITGATDTSMAFIQSLTAALSHAG